jgi:DNA-binding transcriptional MerR regulator
MESFVTIGQFSESARVSPKALRLYAANGLLMPARVDPASGYRYYSAGQLPTARLIGLLRDAGMPLREIRRFLANADDGVLDGYERQLEQELEERREVLRYVRTILEEEPMFDVQVRQDDAIRYRGEKRHVNVAELSDFIRATIGGLMQNGDASGPPFAIFHGAVNEEDDGPVEVGVPFAEGELELPAGETAYVAVTGANCAFPQILGAYDAIARWGLEHKRDFAGAPREVYFTPPGDDARWEIAWPLR